MNEYVELEISEDPLGAFYALPGVAPVWETVPSWVEDPTTGKRTPTGPPERTTDGRTIWQVELLGYRSRYGRREVMPVRLRCASADAQGPALDLSMWPLVAGVTA